MNYYPFHVGDYAAHTGHLEPIEDLAYRRLLDQYYLREGPLPADIAATAKLVRMRSMQADVESVLREFFQLTEEGWRHKRCDEEVAHMQDKQAKARASAAASVEARKAKAERSLAKQPTDAERTLPSQQANVELPTPTPTPTPVIQTPLSPPLAADDQTTKPPDDPQPPDGGRRQRSRGSRIPDDWAPGDSGLAFARQHGLINGRAEAEVLAFLDFWTAKAGTGATKLDWDATWRTWVRRKAEDDRKRPPQGSVDEPAWRREQRERNEAVAGPFSARAAAARRRAATAAIVIDMEATDSTAA